jgi:hypothetical protein
VNDVEALARLIQALEPWRAHLVLVGGWAHRLYRFCPEVNVPTYQPIFTRDTDLAFTNDAPLEGDIKSALERAGFNEQLTGEHRPPVAHYTWGDSDAGFYAEFLTPLRGSGMKRTGNPDATMLKAGVSAQKLRHLDILFIAPWIVRVGPEQGVPLVESMDVQVANPVSFIVQKFLIQKDRPPNKRAQDALYIHDTIELFGAQIPRLNVQWKESVQPALGDRKSAEVVGSALGMFSTVTDTIRDAVRIPKDRTLLPERVQAACHLALTQVFA